MRTRIPKALGAVALGATLATSLHVFGYPEGYSIGLNFGADEFADSSGTLTRAGTLAAADVAGVPEVAQAHWNNVEEPTGTKDSLVADNKGAEVTTTATVQWESNGTWSTTGRGEENNGFPTNTPNYKLLIGYLDTGDPTTTRVTIGGLPAELTQGYDVYVYALGGTGGNRGGGYRIVDSAGAVLRDYILGDASVNPTNFVRDLGLSHDDKGDYFVFKGLTAPNIVVEATTDQPYGMVRAPINAIQLVAATLDKTAPTAPANLAAAEVGANRVSLKWDAATDASNTVFYEVEADGKSVAKVATPTFVSSGLTSKTAHTYRVRALDDSANASDWTAPLSVTTADETVSPGFLKFEYWTGMEAGTDVILLTDWIAAGNPPTLVSYTPSFDSRPVFPDDTHEQYGAKISGFITPAESGSYRFFVRADDEAELWLSKDTNPTNAVLIAEEASTCCEAFKEPDDTLAPNFETSAPQALQANTPYAVFLYFKEGTGGDYVQVAWRKEGDTNAASGLLPISGAFLSSPADPVGASVTFTAQPGNLSATEGTPATLNAAATITSPYVSQPAYQWFRNGTAIPGANAASYTTPELTLASDNGAKYKVSVSVPGATKTSEEATLTVTADQAGPNPLKAAAGPSEVKIRFSEPLDRASAETAGNYTVSGGVTVSKAVLGGDVNDVVSLTTSAMTISNSYTASVTGVKDRFNNAVAAGAQVSFVPALVTYGDIIISDKPIAFYRFEETSGQKTKNFGTLGASADGLYMTGDGPANSTPADISSGEGPRPSEFLGFEASNRSVLMDGANTRLWIDTQKQMLNNLKAFSLEYWVKPANREADPTAFGTRVGLVGQNDAVEYGFIDQDTVQIWSSGGGALDTDYTFPDGEWHHVATIADGKSIKNYYDGVLVGTGGTVTANYGSSTFNVHIGGGGVYDATGNFFTGQFDEVAVFDKAIPAERIAAHFKAGKQGGEVPEPVVDGGGNGGEAHFTQVSFAGGQLTLAWDGTATLEEAASVTGPWTASASQTSPQTVTPTGASKFYRLR